MAARLGVLALVVAVVALLLETQSAAAPGGTTQAASAGGGAVPAAEKRKRRRHRRPGCGRFCHQAGGFGPCAIRRDGTRVCSKLRHPVKIPRQTIRVGRRGNMRIRARCGRGRRCVGAMVVAGRDFEYGRADLRIPGRRARIVRVPLSRKGRRYLRRHHGRDRRVFATAFLNESDTFSNSPRLTLLGRDDGED